MKNIATAEELLAQYRLIDREIYRVDRSEGEVTIWINLFHVDDPRRNNEAMDYPLTISVNLSDFHLIEGDIFSNHEEFGGEILSAEQKNGDIEFVVDCRFFKRKDHEILHFTIGGDNVRFEELSSVSIT
jgi:hypothetical protein